MEEARERELGTPSLAPATVVGGYEILHRLDQGAMGEIYAALHPVIGRRAAVKVMLTRFAGDTASVERFINEARVVNQIGHPNIVDIFEFGRLEDGRPFMVMELLVGEALSDRMRRGNLPLGEALAIMHDIASALMAAHAKGVVHRDLKPDNVFLHELPSEGMRVKLLDFGIAKLLDHPDRGVTRTQAGLVMGTPAYMAPEQARGANVDARVDAYALGAVLFELITGRLPFGADNIVDILFAHVSAAPPRPSELVPGLPAELDDLVVALMAKVPDDRPGLATVQATLRRVARTLGDAPAGATPLPTPPAVDDSAVPGAVAAPRTTSRSRRRLTSAVLVLAASIAVAAIALSSRSRSQHDPLVGAGPSTAAEPSEAVARDHGR